MAKRSEQPREEVAEAATQIRHPPILQITNRRQLLEPKPLPLGAPLANRWGLAMLHKGLAVAFDAATARG